MALGGKEHVLVTSSEKKTRENWIQEVGGILEGKISYLASCHGSFIACYVILIRLNYNNCIHVLLSVHY